MAFSYSQQFWNKGVPKCICKYHSDIHGYDVLVSTEWNREDESLGSERYEVTATATHWLCKDDHEGATDDRIITKAQWDAAAEDVRWEFFPNL